MANGTVFPPQILIRIEDDGEDGVIMIAEEETADLHWINGQAVGVYELKEIKTVKVDVELVPQVLMVR